METQLTHRYAANINGELARLKSIGWIKNPVQHHPSHGPIRLNSSQKMQRIDLLGEMEIADIPDSSFLSLGSHNEKRYFSNFHLP